MANISELLKKIMSARYGKDVRSSIHDAIFAMNEESKTAMSAAITAQDSAQESATNAKKYADNTETTYSKLIDEKGKPNGIATLGNDGKVPSEQLPSYVDSVKFSDERYIQNIQDDSTYENHILIKDEENNSLIRVGYDARSNSTYSIEINCDDGDAYIGLNGDDVSEMHFEDGLEVTDGYGNMLSTKYFYNIGSTKWSMYGEKIGNQEVPLLFNASNYLTISIPIGTPKRDAYLALLNAFGGSEDVLKQYLYKDQELSIGCSGYVVRLKNGKKHLMSVCTLEYYWVDDGDSSQGYCFEFHGVNHQYGSRFAGYIDTNDFSGNIDFGFVINVPKVDVYSVFNYNIPDYYYETY